MNTSLKVYPKKRGFKIRTPKERELAKSIKHKNITFRRMLQNAMKKKDRPTKNGQPVGKTFGINFSKNGQPVLLNNDSSTNFANMKNIEKAIQALENLKTDHSKGTNRNRNKNTNHSKDTNINTKQTVRKSTRIRKKPNKLTYNK